MTEPHDTPGALWYPGDDDGEAVVGGAINISYKDCRLVAICEDNDGEVVWAALVDDGLPPPGGAGVPRPIPSAAICEDPPTEAATLTADSPGVADALAAFQASRYLGDTEALLAALRAFVRARG